ncbi:cell filamentation protein Fic [Campylobacter coli]|nr:cell filamentation protein Fic [Campylobacter coli]EAJ3509120.1 cell filamentation protein Fic [Campylobacter coli]EAJ4480797.1 cell filamentation protein Fic [Campylobacter coli]EAJ5217587.1 cell filamentation protein Fic [Campylobacter coli]EAK4145548.1 cell filamentation protein Fic [Campylobacter coli]
MWDSQENLSEFDKFLIKTNKIGAKSLDELFRKERMITNKKALELGKNPIKGNFDYQHLKDIHKALFEDVYTWAGQDRMQMGLKEKFAKYAPNGAIINFVPGKELDKYSKIIFDELAKNNYLKNSKDLNHFAKNLAKFMGEINALHPFREGNGRTQRIFLNELAKNAGYKLDLNLISKHKMIHACVEASQLKPGRLEALKESRLKSQPSLVVGLKAYP